MMASTALATSAMRRVLQVGQTPRPLQENARSRSCPQSVQRTRAKPWARMPQRRRAPREAWSRKARSTEVGTPQPMGVGFLRLGKEGLQVMLDHRVEGRLGGVAGATDGTGGTIRRRRGGSRPSMVGMGRGWGVGGHLPIHWKSVCRTMVGSAMGRHPGAILRPISTRRVWRHGKAPWGMGRGGWCDGRWERASCEGSERARVQTPPRLRRPKRSSRLRPHSGDRIAELNRRSSSSATGSHERSHAILRGGVGHRYRGCYGVSGPCTESCSTPAASTHERLAVRHEQGDGVRRRGAHVPEGAAGTHRLGPSGAGEVDRWVWTSVPFEPRGDRHTSGPRLFRKKTAGRDQGSARAVTAW